MQLFVGVWPSKKVMQVLADYPRPEDDGGWSRPEQWLVNVRPLGNQPASVITQVVDALSFELDGMPKPKAALTTPRPGQWMGTNVAGLDELRDVVFEATMPIIPVTHPKSLPWQPFIVLRRDRSPKELVHPLSASWTVGEIVIAKGTRTKAGHGYETVEVVKLGA